MLNPSVMNIRISMPFCNLLSFLLIFHTLQSQQLSDSLKIVNKTAGYGYSYKGAKVTFMGLGRILYNNEKAFHYYEVSNFNRTTGNVMLAVGGATFVFGSIVTIMMKNENKTQTNVFSAAWIGLPIMLISVPLHIVAKSNIKKAIQIYNQGPAPSASLNMKASVGITSTGPGLLINF
jgi:hypothetical protein